MGSFFAKPPPEETSRRYISSFQLEQSTNQIQPPLNQEHYPNNEIKTSQYNIITFLPVNLFNQFKRIANAYFLFLLILQLIPQISSLNPTTTIVPLVLVLAVTAIKDAVDDLKRHKSDNYLNNTCKCMVLNRETNKFVEKPWKSVMVGDIVMLTDSAKVPADFLILGTENENGICYVETMELDGETNLKVRRSPVCFKPIQSTKDESKIINFFEQNKPLIECDTPNIKLEKFQGNVTLSFGNGERHPLNNDHVALRGMKIENTKWTIGLIIYTGDDTKLMKNSGALIWKRTHTDKLLNVLVLWIFCILITLCLICVIGQIVWYIMYGQNFVDRGIIPVQEYANKAWKSGALVFWSYLIILNTLVPISLYVSVEIIRLGQSFFINWDRSMFYPPKNQAAEARATTLNEELGQIQYIFSDKTGTLTQNIMVFKKCCINGDQYGGIFDDTGKKARRQESKYGKALDLKAKFKWADPTFKFYDKKLTKDVENGDQGVHEFMTAMALNHTVNIDFDEEGLIEYKAQSPDEAALVSAAKNFGFTFKGGDQETVQLEILGVKKEWKLLNILDFDNDRKMMSVIVKDPSNGQITCYTKGADSSVYNNLSLSKIDKNVKVKTDEALEVFAQDGLRTLVYGKRDLDKDEYDIWQKGYNAAASNVQMRDELIKVANSKMETSLVLLGATAIEDKLQKAVPETIARLADANIKIWVLTGDKLETAINIAYSCNLLTDKLKDVFILNGMDQNDVDKDLDYVRRQMEEYNRTDNLNPLLDGYGLVVTGQALEFCLKPQSNKALFLDIADQCKAVVACRVTPLQKREVVELVKFKNKGTGQPAPVTLAIGDGANDVSMIKAAHIGVGISGEEGSQAQLAADFSFAQFRYLQRLLLVHGRWSYVRFSKFLNYFFYKNFSFTLIQFWYAWFSGFSAITAFDQYFITLYNIVFTSFPVLIVGIFDQDVNDKVSIEHPGLYTPGQQSKYFNKKIFLFQIFKATLTSAFIFFIGYGAFQGLNMHPGTGKDASDYQTFATCLETSLVFIVSLQMALDTQYWTAINHFFLWGSIAMFFLFLFMMYSNTLYSILPNTFFFVGAARNSYAVPTLWFTVLLTVAICILPVLGWRYYLQLVNPSLSYQARMGYRDYKTGKEQPPIGLETEFSRNNIERRSNTHMQRTLTRQSQRRQAAGGVDGNSGETGEQMGRLIMDGTVRRSTRRKKN